MKLVAPLFLILTVVLTVGCVKKQKTVFQTDAPAVMLAASVTNGGDHWFALLELPDQAGNKKKQVISDGVAQPIFDMVLLSPSFSADGKAAYTAQKSGKWFACIDGIFETTYSEAGAPVFSPDGKHHAYMARQNRRSFIVLDGEEREDWDFAGWPVFSPDNKPAYVTKKFPDFFVIIDTVQAGPFSDADTPVFDVTGKHHAYPAAQGDKWFIVYDDEKLPLWDAVGTPVHFGQSVIYPAREYTKWFLIVNGKKGPGFDYVYGCTVSPDNKRVAYAAQENFMRFAVVDGLRGDLFDNIDAVAFSNDSLHCAYRALTPDKAFIIIDKVRSSAFEAVSAPVWGNGNSCTYAGKINGVWNIYRDGKTVFKNAFDAVGSIRFSPEKNCFYAIALQNKTLLMLRWN